MTIRMNEMRRGLRGHDAPLSMLLDDQVLTFPEWCQLNRVSTRTGRRILAGPGAPKVTMLSAKRIGITVGNNKRWQESRERE
jgi:hypothetical protein